MIIPIRVFFGTTPWESVMRTDGLLSPYRAILVEQSSNGMKTEIRTDERRKQHEKKLGTESTLHFVLGRWLETYWKIPMVRDSNTHCVINNTGNSPLNYLFQHIHFILVIDWRFDLKLCIARHGFSVSAAFRGIKLSIKFCLMAYSQVICGIFLLYCILPSSKIYGKTFLQSNFFIAWKCS